MEQFDIIECTLTPRAEYHGSPCLPEVMAATGERLTLHVMWLQDEDDPYPGEFALSLGSGLIHGRAWISSGDVTVIENQGSGDDQ